jgi:hypothetical protein
LHRRLSTVTLWITTRYVCRPVTAVVNLWRRSAL